MDYGLSTMDYGLLTNDYRLTTKHKAYEHEES